MRKIVFVDVTKSRFREVSVQWLPRYSKVISVVRRGVIITQIYRRHTHMKKKFCVQMQIIDRYFFLLGPPGLKVPFPAWKGALGLYSRRPKWAKGRLRLYLMYFMFHLDGGVKKYCFPLWYWVFGRVQSRKGYIWVQLPSELCSQDYSFQQTTRDSPVAD